MEAHDIPTAFKLFWHRQLDRRLTEVGQLGGVGAALVCDYAASRAPVISAQSSKAWARAVR
jgi:hypothetical protein